MQGDARSGGNAQHAGPVLQLARAVQTVQSAGIDKRAVQLGVAVQRAELLDRLWESQHCQRPIQKLNSNFIKLNPKNMKLQNLV